MEIAGNLGAYLGLPEERQFDLKSAVAEACLNAMEHGNKLSAHKMVTIVFATNLRNLKVEVYDRGRGLEKKPRPPKIENKIAGREAPQGWGIFLMRRLVDRVEFRRDHRRGHMTRLIMKLPDRALNTLN